MSDRTKKTSGTPRATMATKAPPSGERRVYGYRVGKNFYKSYSAAVADKGSDATVLELHTGNIFGG